MATVDASLYLENDPRVVATARAFVRQRLVSPSAMAEGLDGVVVVASELVANGLLHARTPLVLRVLAREQRMRVEVRDGSRRAPRPIEVSLQTEGGRGLLVVSRLAASWGWEFEGEGKVVWAEFDRARLRPQVSGGGQAREQFEPPGQRRAGDTHPPRGCAT